MNRAVAVAEAGDTADALAQVAALDAALADYQPYYAVKADLLARTGALVAARLAYTQAIARSHTAPERSFLTARHDALRG